MDDDGDDNVYSQTDILRLPQQVISVAALELFDALGGSGGGVVKFHLTVAATAPLYQQIGLLRSLLVTWLAPEPRGERGRRVRVDIVTLNVREDNTNAINAYKKLLFTYKCRSDVEGFLVFGLEASGIEALLRRGLSDATPPTLIVETLLDTPGELPVRDQVAAAAELNITAQPPLGRREAMLMQVRAAPPHHHLKHHHGVS